jgi:hypothetical protein
MINSQFLLEALYLTFDGSTYRKVFVDTFFFNF